MWDHSPHQSFGLTKTPDLGGPFLCDSRIQSQLLIASAKQRLPSKPVCPNLNPHQTLSRDEVLRLKFTQVSFDTSSHRFFSELPSPGGLARFECPEFSVWPLSLEFPQLFRFGTLIQFPNCDALGNAFCITREYHNQLVSSLLGYYYTDNPTFMKDPDAASVLEQISKLSTNIHNLDAEVSLLNFFQKHMSLHDHRIYGSSLALFYNDEGQFQIRCRSCCTVMLRVCSP